MMSCLYKNYLQDLVEMLKDKLEHSFDEVLHCSDDQKVL